MAEKGPIRAFLSYAHEDHAWRDQVLLHLGWLRNSGRLEHFDDRHLKVSEDWEARIIEELQSADVIIILISPHFLGSKFCTLTELLVAAERERRGEVRLVPIVCDHLDLGDVPVSRLQCLPQDERNDLKPLRDWPNPNVPLAVIAAKVRGLVKELETSRSAAPLDPGAKSQREEVAAWNEPWPPSRCFGRQKETGEVVAALLREPPDPVIVYGAAGIGKTVLTLHAAHHPDVVGRFKERRAFVALDKAEDHRSLLYAIRSALSMPASVDPWAGLEDALEPAPALLVLDSLETPWAGAEGEVEDVLKRLADIPAVLLLASMRGGHPPVRPAWKLRLEVKPLAPPHARELLLDIAGDLDPQSPLMPSVIDALDGVPLAIKLFAAQAAGLGSLDLPWRQWCKKRVSMLEHGQGGDRRSSLAVSLACSLDSPRINGPARRLYAALGRLPDGWQSDTADELLPGGIDDAHLRLLRTRLVHPEAGRLRMLKPVREHALAQPLEPTDERHLAELLGALADALPLQQESPPDPERPARARREIANVEAGLAGMSPSGPAERHDLGWRWMQVGDTRLARSELAAALRAYEAAEAEFRGCMGAEPDHARWRRSAAIALLRIGEARRARGEFAAARLACATAVSMLEALAEIEPGKPQWRRDLAVARSGHAELLVAQGDVAGGAAAHAAALDVLQALAAAEPADTALQRDLLVAWIKLGQLNLRQRDLAAALAAHERAAEFAAALAQRDPANPEWRRDRSVARLGTGDVLREQGDLAAALVAYEEARTIREGLAAAEPGNPRRERDLAVCWERLAMTRHRLGDRARALEAWRRALAISERLAEAHPDNVDLRLAPAIHLNGIADALDRGDAAARREAEELVRRALDLLRAAAEGHRLDAERQGWIPALEAKLAELAGGRPGPA